jgi:2-oxoglutarate ferredoxin oxidoreductase subunit delta
MLLLNDKKDSAMAKKGNVTIDREMCKGCHLCIRACPVKVLEIDTEMNSSGSYPAKVAQPDKCNQHLNLSAGCIACGNCYEVCPDVCIEIYEVEE